MPHVLQMFEVGVFEVLFSSGVACFSVLGLELEPKTRLNIDVIRSIPESKACTVKGSSLPSKRSLASLMSDRLVCV